MGVLAQGSGSGAASIAADGSVSPFQLAHLHHRFISGNMPNALVEASSSNGDETSADLGDGAGWDLGTGASASAYASILSNSNYSRPAQSVVTNLWIQPRTATTARIDSVGLVSFDQSQYAYAFRNTVSGHDSWRFASNDGVAEELTDTETAFALGTLYRIQVEQATASVTLRIATGTEALADTPNWASEVTHTARVPGDALRAIIQVENPGSGAADRHTHAHMIYVPSFDLLTS